MKIALFKESRTGETRVALTPDAVKNLVGDGWDVVVQRGAGERAHFIDATYEAAGATIAVLSKVLTGVAALEPTAVALWNQISSGTPATAAQLQIDETDAHAALAQLDTDIEAKIATSTT